MGAQKLSPKQARDTAAMSALKQVLDALPTAVVVTIVAATEEGDARYQVASPKEEREPGEWATLSLASMAASFEHLARREGARVAEQAKKPKATEPPPETAH